jgi:ankyrin repeat protein
VRSHPGWIRESDDAPEISDVLDRGADVNAADPGGYTPLMYATNLGLVDNVKLLLQHGADATRKSKYGETELSVAERPGSTVDKEGRRQVVEILKGPLAGAR